MFKTHHNKLLCTYKRKSGMIETKTLHLRKDEDGKWAIHLKNDK